MASLYVSYYGSVLAGCGKDPLGSEVLTTSGESEQATPPDHAVVAMLFSDAAHYVTDGPDPEASDANGVLVPADIPVWIALNRGYKLAAVTA